MNWTNKPRLIGVQLPGMYNKNEEEGGGQSGTLRFLTATAGSVRKL